MARPATPVARASPVTVVTAAAAVEADRVATVEKTADRAISRVSAVKVASTRRAAIIAESPGAKATRVVTAGGGDAAAVVVIAATAVAAAIVARVPKASRAAAQFERNVN
jgi:hypothetical protein